MIEMVDRAPVENSQIEDGNVADGSGMSIPAAAAALLTEIRPQPEPLVQLASDDDIPF